MAGKKGALKGTRRARQSCLDPRLVDKADGITQLLMERGRTIICAESCTAGLLAAALSQGDGASDVLHGGFVTYTKEQKTKALGVSDKTLERAGGVTADVARQMAQGALRRSSADIALSVTGVLGPSPDEDGNPVGLVYFGYAVRGRPVRVLRKRFRKAPHDQLRAKVIMTAFDLIAKAKPLVPGTD